MTASQSALRTSTHPRPSFSTDLEPVGNQALYSGYPTKGGGSITIEFANTGMGTAGDYALAYMVCGGILSIRGGSVDVFE